MSPNAPRTEQFIKLLTDHQVQLRGFIMSAVADHTHAADILQQTNIVLWQKADELRSLDEFMPWALTVARYKVLSFVRDKQRVRLVFQPKVVEAMAQTAADQVEELPDRQAALRECLKQLGKTQLEVLGQRYVANKSINDISTATGNSVDSVKSRLKRVRKLLAECIERRIQSWEHA